MKRVILLVLFFCSFAGSGYIWGLDISEQLLKYETHYTPEDGKLYDQGGVYTSLKKNDCLGMVPLDFLIRRLDGFISEYDIVQPEETKKLIHAALIERKQRLLTILGDEAYSFLIGYYSEDAGVDYFSGCFDAPEANDMYPLVEGGHLIVTGYVKPIQKREYPDCQYGIGACDTGIETTQYVFVLTEALDNDRYTDNLNHAKLDVGSELPLGCEVDGEIRSLRNSVHVLERTYANTYYKIPANIVSELLRSSPMDHITIRGSLGVTFMSDHGSTGIICPGIFKSIHIISTD